MEAKTGIDRTTQANIIQEKTWRLSEDVKRDRIARSWQSTASRFWQRYKAPWQAPQSRKQLRAI